MLLFYWLSFFALFVYNMFYLKTLPAAVHIWSSVREINYRADIHQPLLSQLYLLVQVVIEKVIVKDYDGSRNLVNLHPDSH